MLYVTIVDMLGLRVAIAVVCLGISQGNVQFPRYSSCSPIGITISDARGRITSPNYPSDYPRNMDCKWRITSSNSIRLILEDLDNAEQYLERKACQDHVWFTTIGKDGTSTYLVPKTKLCGNDVSELAQSVFIARKGSEDEVTVEIHFESDYSEERKGFSLYFETLCNETITGTSGVLTSLNYPAKYPNFADCYTEIIGPVGSYIEFDVTMMQFHNIQDCDSDYIQINAGPPGAYQSKRTKYCEPSTKLIQTDSAMVTVHLVTDDRYTNTGFSATWRAVFPTTPLTTLPETTTPTPIATTTSATTTSPTTAEITTVARIPDIAIDNCSYTSGGFVCQRWDVNTPHVPTILPEEDDRDHNYCRITASGTRSPWCYTTDPRKEWEYCNVSNCEEPTTVSAPSTPQFTSTIATELSTTNNISRLGRKDESSTGQPSSVLWYPILAALALLFIVCIAIFFLCKGRKKKRTARLNESVTSDVVSFHRFAAEDEYRPRENTYVEIPFLDEVREDHATRVNREGHHNSNGKAFVRLDNASGSRNSSTPSIDSVLAAKEAARQNFERGASTSQDLNAYSVAEDVQQHIQAAPSLPRQRENALRSQSMTEQEANLQNVYHAIDVQASDASNENEYHIPASSHSVRSSTASSDIQELSNKKIGFWKKNPKSKQRAVNGFSNPIYRKESSVDSDSLGRNPFDSDEADSAQESSRVQRLESIPLPNEGVTEFEDAGNVYNAPSMIPHVSEADPYRHDLNVSLETTQSPDSPYMMPKLSQNEKIPADATIISISPNLIDDTDHKTDCFQTFRPVTDPTSPTFDLSQDFTYDAPPQRRTTQSFASVKSDISSNTENSSFFFSNHRDSGNASISTAGQDDDKNNEYCIMGEFDKPPSTLTSTLDPNDMNFKSSNRASQLYLSMRGFEEEDRRTSESSVTASTGVGRTNL